MKIEPIPQVQKTRHCPRCGIEVTPRTESCPSCKKVLFARKYSVQAKAFGYLFGALITLASVERFVRGFNDLNEMAVAAVVVVSFIGLSSARFVQLLMPQDLAVWKPVQHSIRPIQHLIKRC